jgi:hypothetical protein
MAQYGVERVITVLNEEINRFDNAADDFPQNDVAYVQLENELARLEKILAFCVQVKGV